MSNQQGQARGVARPTLALRYVSMTRGAEIRRARLARGWSQTQLAKEAGVGQRTIVRIESGEDQIRSVVAVERALGLGEFGRLDEGTPIHRATAAQLLAEIGRRLFEHEQQATILDRFRTGEMPDHLIGQPGIGVGPNVESDQDQATDDQG